MVKALVLDAYAINQLQSISVDLAWFSTFTLPTRHSIGKRVVGDVCYLLSKKAKTNSRLIVVSLEDGELFGGHSLDNRGEAFDRLTRAALSCFEATVTIPANWRPYHWRSRVSFQANSVNSNEPGRLLLDKSPNGTRHCYFYGVDREGKGDLSEFVPDFELFSRAIGRIAPALETPPQYEQDESRDFDLNDSLSLDVTRGYSYDIWYKSHLTAEQASFVNADRGGPLRLRGAAGSGKTLAMVMRFLKMVYEAADDGKAFRVAFVAHSTSTVELIRKYIINIDDRGALFDTPDGVEISLCTLHDLAEQHLGYELKGMQALSLDAYDALKMEIEYLGSIFKEYGVSDWLARKSFCSKLFVELVDEALSGDSRPFIFDLLSEFGCVIDVQSGATPSERRQNYFTERRAQWMLPAENASDKQVVVDLHKEFSRAMAELGVVTLEQMTADFLGFLSSNQWSATRLRSGFDAIFVDELHLLNRVERSLFHLLTKDEDPPFDVYMAYDPKQSPKDTFLGQAGESVAKDSVWASTKLGTVEPIVLSQVFRYTDQIAAFLQGIDRSFPAANFGSEWAVENKLRAKGEGPKPTLVRSANERDTYKNVFPIARDRAKKLGAGKRVAMLCMSYELFETYLVAGNHRDDFVPITGRAQLDRVERAGKKFIFSMPEYVAGLQFDTVFLIEVNENDVKNHGAGLPGRRRFLSNLYLGASRAENDLILVTNLDRGGAPSEVDFALGHSAE
ncbi:MAG: hypothetical protein H3C38_04745 [Rhodospirillales bacterium]|nr:hypothetical protein [Rhodospirillales bacterium]